MEGRSRRSMRATFSQIRHASENAASRPSALMDLDSSSAAGAHATGARRPDLRAQHRGSAAPERRRVTCVCRRSFTLPRYLPFQTSSEASLVLWPCNRVRRWLSAARRGGVVPSRLARGRQVLAGQTCAHSTACSAAPERTAALRAYIVDPSRCRDVCRFKLHLQRALCFGRSTVCAVDPGALGAARVVCPRLMHGRRVLAGQTCAHSHRGPASPEPTAASGAYLVDPSRCRDICRFKLHLQRALCFGRSTLCAPGSDVPPCRASFVDGSRTHRRRS
jgi:hypothetical protein